MLEHWPAIQEKVYITFYLIILKNKWGKLKTNIWEKIIKYLELNIGVYPHKVCVGIDYLYKMQKYKPYSERLTIWTALKW